MYPLCDVSGYIEPIQTPELDISCQWWAQGNICVYPMQEENEKLSLFNSFPDQKYTLGSKNNPRQQEETSVNRNICTLPVWDWILPAWAPE